MRCGRRLGPCQLMRTFNAKGFKNILNRKFEHSIALRYLRGAQGKSEGRKFLRFVTTIAVTGVSVGVCALIVALAIVRGFSNEIEDKIVGFGAQIQIENFRDAPLQRADTLRAMLERYPEVSIIAPVIQEFVLLRGRDNRADGVSLNGVEFVPAHLQQNILAGTADLTSTNGNDEAVVIGMTLSRNLHLEVGDRVHAFSVRGQPGESTTIRTPRLKQFRVVGIYETSLADFDETYIFASIEASRGLLGYTPDQVTRFDLSLKAGIDPRNLSDRIDDDLPFPVMARSIYDIYKSLFAWVNLQESIIPLVIGIIVLVAAFNIIGTLLMIILEKTREIGVFASMGASRQMLRRIFVYLGLYIGVAGVIIGELVAMAFSWLQLNYSIIPLPKEAYYMSAAPIELSLVDFVAVAFITTILCGLASYIPARFAAKIEPIRAIHLR